MKSSPMAGFRSTVSPEPGVVPAMAETCDVCETTVTRLEFIMEGISRAPGKKPLQMHVDACTSGTMNGGVAAKRLRQ
jgi:hypothetical protein